MTRKDYIALANSIKQTLYIQKQTGAIDTTTARVDAIYATACNIATTLKSDNGRFDRERFMTACGF